MSRRTVLGVLAVLLVAFVVWRGQAPQAPAATWRTGAGTEVRQARDYDELAPETPFRLSLHTTETLHVYVFSHSVEDGTLLLWPSPDLESDLATPLAAGHHVLPGAHEGKELAWTSRSGTRSTTTVIAVASPEPIAELEADAARLRRWTNSVFPDRAMLVTKPAAGAALVGGPGSTTFHSPLLTDAAAAAITQAQPNGPMAPVPGHPGAHASVWRFVEKKRD